MTIPDDYDEVMDSKPPKIDTKQQIQEVLGRVKDNRRLDWLNIGENAPVPKKMGVRAVDKNGKRVHLSSNELSQGQQGEITEKMRAFANALVFSREHEVIDESKQRKSAQY